MSTTPHAKHPIYGLMAEFHTAEELVDAVHKVHAAGFRHVDAFTPCRSSSSAAASPEGWAATSSSTGARCSNTR